MTALPLEGVRVLCVSHMWAAPIATRYLADMGAEVIKVEAIQRIDSVRNFTQLRPEDPEGYERSVMFHGPNRNKLGVTIDLTRPNGVALFKRLVATSDIVVENFSRRVMANFGLEYDVLRQVNPRIIMISMSGFGATGPWQHNPAYSVPIDQLSGRTYVTGYHDGGAMLLGIGILPEDPIVALFAAFAAQAALAYRERSDEGQYIDLSESETMICLLGHEIAALQIDGRGQERWGNRHPAAAPQGCYRCAGEDKWVAISITSNDDWHRFRQAIGNPNWAAGPDLCDVAGRQQRHDDLDRLIEAWTSEHDHYTVMHVLQAAGVPCGAVLTAPELLADPHLNERCYFEEATREDVGTHRYPGMQYRLSKTPGKIRRAAPRLGEHNDYVFGELLGLSAAEMRALADDGIIGTTPILAGDCEMT